MYGSKQAGLGRYVEKLISNILEQDNENEYVIFLRKENFDSFNTHRKNVKKVLVDIPWYGWREQFLFPIYLFKEKLDLMHFPHWNVPVFTPPFVLTVHDLILIHFPDRRASKLHPFFYFLKHLLFRCVLWFALRRSLAIITVSKFSKDDLIKTLKIKPKKIIVTYIAPFDQKKKSNENILKKYKITKPYLLYVGVAFPHKNLEGLIKAWKIFTDKYGFKYQLVLTGKENYFYKRLKKYTKKKYSKELYKSIVFTNYVPDENLPFLYENAKVFVFPSLYEGFGIPPLEAMQYNIPVLSSVASCMPEVLNDATLFVNAEDSKAFAESIYKILTDDDLKINLLNNSKKVLEKYSWKKTAIQTLDVYKKVLK